MANSKASRKLQLAFTHGMLLKSRLWRRLADNVAKVHGLSDATSVPLLLIGRLGPLTQIALADAIGVEAPTLVRHLDTLSGMGLVERREDPNDRRAKRLSLTPSGRLLVAKLESDLVQLRENTFAQVSAEDFEACMRVFRAIDDYASKSIEAEAGPPRGARA